MRGLEMFSCKYARHQPLGSVVVVEYQKWLQFAGRPPLRQSWNDAATCCVLCSSVHTLLHMSQCWNDAATHATLCSSVQNEKPSVPVSSLTYSAPAAELAEMMFIRPWTPWQEPNLGNLVNIFRHVFLRLLRPQKVQVWNCHQTWHNTHLYYRA